MKHASATRLQRGLSMVELMVGIAVGLFVVGGATKLFVDYLGSNRTLLLDTRVNQDLRAAADIVARDLRRSGYWRNAMAGIWTGGVAPAASNPHAAIAHDPAASTVQYSYGRVKTGNTDDVLDTNEEAGFRLEGNVLQFKDGQDNWQPITDIKSLKVTYFDITQTIQWVELAESCSCIWKLTCTEAGVLALSNRPRVGVRRYDFVIRGEAAGDPAVKRQIQESVRVRNDYLTGSCP